MTFSTALRLTIAVLGAAVGYPAFAQEAIHPETVQKVKAAVDSFYEKHPEARPGFSWFAPEEEITCAQPRYPKAAIRFDLQGTAILKFKVNAEGKPLNAQLVQSSGWALLDEAALAAFSLCVFPGEDIEQLYRQPYRFVLK